MAGNSYGQLFRITTFGESHGGAVGVAVDGCPANLEISEADIQKELDKRRPGQSGITTPRKEGDVIHILSGVYEGRTIGTPILLLAKNEDARSEDYDNLIDAYRPGHADYAYDLKYGVRDPRGGGRASGRETLARVAAGAIAKKYLKEKYGVEFLSYVERVGGVSSIVDLDSVTREQIEANIVRCPDNDAAEKMIKLIESVRNDGDSVGGVVRGIIRKVPAGLGEPVFDKVPADLAKAMMSIGAVKGFEFGSGFAGTRLRGSEHNDEFCVSTDAKIRTKTNNAGGTLGGITIGEDIYFRVAFKPVSTIIKKQRTVNKQGRMVDIEIKGRHDPCVLPRVVPIVDAMAAITILDHVLRSRAQSK